MQAQKKKKQIFGGVVLFLMMALAMATAVMAASGQWANEGSYSLVIQKQFDTTGNLPDDVLTEAKEQTYRFHIEGYRLDKAGERIPIDEIVEIGPDSKDWSGNGQGSGVEPWKQSEVLCSDGPIHVSVTEITNDKTITVDGQEYNMGGSRAEATTLFTEAPQVRDLNSNGKITISRPEKKLVHENGTATEVPVTTTSFFRIHSEWPWDEVDPPEDWKQFDETVELAPGKEFSYKNLFPGQYIVEDLSVSGYQIQLGSRKDNVPEGESGEFYINSKPGRLVITAGGSAGDGGVHRYRVERIWAPGDAEAFVDRYTDGVASGASYTLENLPKGQYRVTEYISSAATGYKVKVAETEEKTVTYSFKKAYFGTTSAKYTKFSAGGDYITDFKFGPLRNSSNNKINSNYSYKFAYRYKSAENGPGTYSTRGAFNAVANLTYNDKKSCPVIYPRDDGTLAFAVWNVTATTGDHVDLSWIEHNIVKAGKPYDNLNADKEYTFNVDERGWMEITAPAAETASPGAEDIKYTYTLRKEENGPAVKTLTLTPGASRRIEGLEAGSYLLTETVSQTAAAGFKIEVSGDPFGSTVAGHSFDLTVMDNRQLTIIKPKGNDKGRTYTFVVERTGGETLETPFAARTVTLRAGERDSSIELPAGRYRVTPTDDMTEVFELTCSDSSQVHAAVPSDQSAAVTFTNVFVPGNMGYRYVHEYYLLKDGQYVYEGNSPITTVGGRPDEKETYTSIDITKETDYTFTGQGGQQTYTYAYLPSRNAYGYVDVDVPESGDPPEAGKSEDLQLKSAEESKPEIQEDTGQQPEGDASPEARENTDLQSEGGEESKPTAEENTGRQPEGGEEPKPAAEENTGQQPEGGEEPKPAAEENTGRQPEGEDAPAAGENAVIQEENTARQPDDGEEPKPETRKSTELQQPDDGAVLQAEESGNPQAGEGDAVDSDGFCLRNQSAERGGDGTSIVYQVDDELTNKKAIKVDKDKSQIIILRYFRVLPEDQQGSYKYVHVYYRRTAKGEVWEGTSQVTTTAGQLGVPYSADNVVQMPNYRPAGQGTTYRYTYNGRPSYGELTDDHTAPHIELYPVSHDPTDKNHYHYNPDSDATHIVATENGQQIIILRYYRDVVDPAEPAGGYKVVHEYYLRERLENQDTEDISGDVGSGDESEAVARAGYGGEAEDASSFSGTLSSDSQYTYTFEGARAIETLSAPLGSPHKDTEVEKNRRWKPENSQTEYPYAYKDAVYGNTGEDGHYDYVSNMEWAASTEEGGETIILRYFREEGDSVNPPGEPGNPSENPGNSGHSTETAGSGAQKSSEEQYKKAPPTGDDSRPALYILLAAGSLAGADVLRRIRRKTVTGQR